MSGIMNLANPSGLLKNLQHESALFAQDPNDSYAAINALRDAYHLREWIWHDRLQADAGLQTRVMGAPGNEAAWNTWVNSNCNDFKLVRELCNGSKHFEPDTNGVIQGFERSTLSGGARLSDNFKTSDASFYVRDKNNIAKRIADIVSNVETFWRKLFHDHPGLA
ncbi:MAG: hypothetical protein EOS55_24745 [Mesorhizobium sp.]|nr:MAG: hypothetical protein EOS55_24745 [Mesorhizobium sp.]